MPAIRLTTVEQVEALVAELFDPDRDEPIVVVTTRNGELEPLIEADDLAEAIAPLPVRLVATGPLTWELTGLLPDGLGVFGGAARIWWPGLDRADRPHRHPLIFAYSREEGLRAADRIRQELERRSAAVAGAGSERVAAARRRSDADRLWTRMVAADQRPHPVGAVAVGTVREAAPGGADVEIAPGWSGWLVRRRRDPELAVGDTVQVRIAGYDERGPQLERPPRSPVTAAAPSAPPGRPSVRPGPHLFRPHRTEPASAPSDGHAPAPVVDDEVALLRRLLGEAEEERLQAERRADDAAQEAQRAIRQLARSERELKQELRRARDRMAWLEEQLRGTGRYDDAEQQFRHEVQLEWQRSHTASDRTAWPLARYRIGPAFLPSLDALAGVSRAKVVAVCVEVLTGRAETLTSREVHPLRCSEAGDAGDRMRAEDGARAWRVSLQVKTPSARRLHFWRLPDGSIELSKVGVHDDLTIV